MDDDLVFSFCHPNLDVAATVATWKNTLSYFIKRIRFALFRASLIGRGFSRVEVHIAPRLLRSDTRMYCREEVGAVKINPKRKFFAA